MNTTTHFSFPTDIWDTSGNNIAEHLAGLDDLLMSMAAYVVAISANPKEKITLRQGAQVVKAARGAMI